MAYKLIPATATATALVALALFNPAMAQKKYGSGATDTEITIGQTMPYGGAASAYLARRRLQPAQVRKLVEEDKVLLDFNSLGTPTNTAIHRYLISVNVWQPMGTEPRNIMHVLSRQKDIQYASRGKAHVKRQHQIHRLRHVVRQLETRFSEEQRKDPELRELLSYDRGTTMHLVRLLAPRVDCEDHTKDIDFSQAGIRTRWQAGYAQPSVC